MARHRGLGLARLASSRLRYPDRARLSSSLGAYTRDEPSSAEFAGKTGPDGRTSFRVVRSGQCLVRLVHIRRCVACTDTDWESFWASYAFAIRRRGRTACGEGAASPW